ncbi:MAG TPA: S41 family peptidase [Candidatus Baltobacteraceae bacterium]|nr:S41 family peptidase [Candidatus Baltobacteraceae bacterium]
MSTAIRAVIAALLVAAVAFAGAVYISFRNGLNVADSSYDTGGSKIASLDLNGILGPRVLDNQLVGIAFRQVEHVYYRPVDSTTLVNGEHAGLLEYLQQYFKAKNVRVTPSLPQAQSDDDQTADVHVLDQQLAYAEDHYAQYLGKDGRTQLTEAALDGMLGSLKDPYTVYLSPDQIRALNEQLDGGNFGGIGVFIYQLKDGRVLLQPIEGLPAARAGMRGDEIVVSIDGKPVSGKPLDDVERMIRGPEGKPVTIATHPYAGTASHVFHIVREIIHVPTVHQKMEDGYNYIRLSDFGETSAEEVKKALADGANAGAKGTILDLRDNGGGLLDAAVSISSYFVPRGSVVVTEIDRDGNRESQYANGNVVRGGRPLVILVNGYTASASEITSGALQDYKLATLIGTKTFGKGVVQGIFTMPNGGALKITTQRYVTPAGRDIQHKGIEPNIVVQQCPNPQRCQEAALIDTPRDRQLAAAKAFLNHLTR